MADEVCSVLALFEEDPEMPVAIADDDTETVLPLRMRFDSPWEWTANVQGNLVTVIPSNGAPIYFNVQEDGTVALPAGISSKRDFRMQVESETDERTRSKSIKGLTLVDASGQKVRFNVSNGLGSVNSITSAKGRTTTAAMRSTNVKTLTNESGKLAGCYSSTGGLMKMTAGSDGSQLLAWYSPKKVTANADGSYTTNGTAFKTASYKMTRKGGVKTTTFTRQQEGLPAQTITHVVNGNITTVTKGEGDETIIHTYETNSLYGNMLEEIATVRGINDATPASCTRTVRQYTDGGWLLISQTAAYNTPIAQTTTYEYNAQYRVSRINYHNGNYVEYEYDSEGRVTKETRPWGNGGKQMTRNIYAANSSRFYDTRPIKVYTDYEMANGTFLNLAVTDYTYEDSAEVERTTATTYAAGVNHQQVTIDETYGEAAAYAYAIGKPKFSQAVNGVQTWHDYEATTEHGAAHKHTVTTKANGELVAAQSRKTETFIAEDETTNFTQESIWDGTQWLLLNTTAYEYDDEQRVTKKTRGNGRFSTTEWMCCGKLRETDEDGITTTYAYDSAHQLIETSRDAVYNGDVCVTPETITEYTRDAAGRVLSTTRRIGAMETTETSEYDLLGRTVKQTDLLGRITTKEYSADGLITTVTTPAGATFVTTNNLDGSTASISGTGQRAQHYSYDISGKNLRTTAKLSAGNIISQTIVNGFGLTVVKTAPSSNGYIYTRSEFNANGQLVKQYRDTGWNTTSTAPTLYEYDTFGNVAKQTVALSESPDVSNSPTAETVYGVVNSEDGVYQTVSVTRYNSQGTAITESRKILISMLSGTLMNKQIITDARGNDSVSRTEYEAPSKVKNFHITPTSEIVAESTVMDGFTIATKNHAGHVSSAIRIYTSTGMTLHSTDGRGNTSTREFDVNGRPVKHTDAANFSWTILYDEYVNSPSVIIDPLGNEAHFKYDVRGRKIAEWGTKVRPVKFGYDDANHLTSLTTFRVSSAQISDDPSERSDGDTTSWSYDPATGLELSKTFADNSVINKSYDAYNRLLTITDARGRVKTNSYEHARGLLMGITYSDNTTAKTFAYNHIGQLTQVSDASGIIAYEYNDFGEKVGDTLTADGVVHHIAENRDDFGRSTGYTYAKNDVNQQTVNTVYGSDGRIDSAGFIHNGTEKAFNFNYLTGSNLLQSIVMPNNMTLTNTYEPTRNLLVGMQYKRSSTSVVEREYEYDALGAPIQRHTSRQGSIVNDVFAYNSRAELVEAQVNGTDFEYNYDNNLNRTAVTETGVTNLYTSNELNCLTAITSEDETVHINATYDENANPTTVHTRTGAWNVEYDAENRPVLFSNEETNTVIECLYDSFGRRTVKKTTVNDTVTSHQRFIYRGYQQIACLDLTRTSHPCIWLITWDPTQPVATRPLSIQKDGNWFAYGWDLTKNVCEVFGAAGYIRTTYSYKPYGEVISSGDVEQPIQWSSEYTDSELALVYYNYRHYNPATGSWLGRDNVESRNLQAYVGNNPIHYFDRLGMDFSIDPYFPPNNTDASDPIRVEDLPITLRPKEPSLVPPVPVFGKRDNTKYTVTVSADINGCVKMAHAFVQKEGYPILDWGTDPITLSVPVTITQNYDAESSDWTYDAQITYKLAAFGDSVVTQLASSLMQKDVTSLGCSYKYDVNTDGNKHPFINGGASVNFGDNPTYGFNLSIDSSVINPWGPSITITASRTEGREWQGSINAKKTLVNEAGWNLYTSVGAKFEDFRYTQSSVTFGVKYHIFKSLPINLFFETSRNWDQNSANNNTNAGVEVGLSFD